MRERAKDRAERFGPDVMNYVERSVVLQTLDHLWREHIVNLDHLRSSSASAAMRSATRCRNTSRKASSCSRPCWSICARP
jgi:preprotein translocase subunit SecA